MKLITTLAEYQTDFWLQVGLKLKENGEEVAFLSFDDRSTEQLIAHGFQTFSLSPADFAVDTSDANFSVVTSTFNMQNLNYWFSHERMTFGINDSTELRRKLIAYILFADRACAALRASGKTITMVQELGGFLSVIASFFAARKNGIDNWFIEPAFFRGRVFFLKNSFAAPSVNGNLVSEVSPEVKEYLEKTLASGAIVVPLKDQHQYTTAYRKVINWKNLRRLTTKLIDKYCKGKRQEFGYIGRHVAIHARMLRNSFRLRRHYQSLETLGQFVYYPLHVPGDMALTLRSPEYLDQLALIDYLARTIPHTCKLAIKEHPAMIGAVDATRLIELLTRYDNLVLLPPSTNNYEVIKKADALVSINSKSGAEAALLGKPVFVLGDAFYRNAPMVVAVEKLSDLTGFFASGFHTQKSVENDLMVGRYFETLWQNCHPGELYITDPERVQRFTTSLMEATI